MSFAFEAIGTHWQIDILDNPPLPEADLLRAIRERIDAFDKNYSRFRADSLVTEMSKRPGMYTLPDDAKPMFDLYERVYRVTNGAVTPLIGNTMVEAGYDAEYSLKPKTLHTPPAWDIALDYHFPTLTIKQPVLLDVGAAGKGYLIDIISTLIYDFGSRSFCVDAGGDIFYRHEKNQPLKVGLENPLDTSQAVGVAELTNQSICGSAGNRRAWGQFHHIINPHTLVSPRNILATWVVAENTLLADALTTCLFFVPASQLTEFAFDYVIVFEDGTAEKSAGFPGELFLA